MHPLAVFPSLLSWSQLAPFLIRVLLGVTLAHFGYRKIAGKGQSSGSNSVIYGWLEVVVAIFMVIGLYTQVAALVNVIILAIKLGFKAHEGKLLSDGVNYYVLMLVMALSLMLTGPGLWAFDLSL